MALILSTTSGTGANLTSELALGTDYTASADCVVHVRFALSSLNGAAANITSLVRVKTSGGVTILELSPNPSAVAKRANANTFYGDSVALIPMKSGEKMELRVLSSNASDTSVAWERNVYDASYSSDGTISTYTGNTPQTGDAYAVVTDSTFGNAKLVRSTTPANTLDVSSTGEAGLDFANLKQATGATTLNNITIPRVTLADTLSTYTGNTPQTGDAYLRIGAAGAGLTAIGAVTLAASQPNYAPAKAGDAMALTTGERSTLATALDTTLTGSHGSGSWQSGSGGFAPVSSIDLEDDSFLLDVGVFLNGEGPAKVDQVVMAASGPAAGAFARITEVVDFGGGQWFYRIDPPWDSANITTIKLVTPAATGPWVADAVTQGKLKSIVEAKGG